MQYRPTRNCEASIIEFLRDELTASWTNIHIEKTFTKIYGLSLPAICVRCGTTSYDPVEIGGNSLKREPQILIDIFASSDGQRLDLKDFVIDVIKNGCIYYNYEIESGAIKSKVASGRIRVLNIEDTPINFEEDRNSLDIHDRYRNLITLTISTGKVE